MLSCRHAPILAAAGLCLAVECSVVRAQVAPSGPEFVINTYTPGFQRRPDVAQDASGNFVAVWEATNDGDGQGVFAQRFDADGVPLGSEFQVNTYTTGFQAYPAIGMTPTGEFVVVWESSGQDGDSTGIFGQRFDATGVPQGVEFAVNTQTASQQIEPCVATDTSGAFVVAWASYAGDGDSWGIAARQFDSSGAPLAVEFQVNTGTTGAQLLPDVSAAPSGAFVVAWDGRDTDLSGVFARRFDATGAPLGAEFQINTHTTSHQGFPSLATDAAGNFVVAWSSFLQDGSGDGVFAQRFDGSGAPVGGEFQVNTATTSDQSRPDVAIEPGGAFVIAWESDGADGNSQGVVARRFDASGVPQGGDFVVNTNTVGREYRVAVSMTDAEHFVIVWQDNFNVGNADIRGQRFGLCGNGMLDSGEVCDQGPANGASTSCCSYTCELVTAGTECRPVAGPCDLAETCTGSVSTCPADAFVAAGLACPDDGESCTDDVCDGGGTCVHPSATCIDHPVAGAKLLLNVADLSVAGSPQKLTFLSKDANVPTPPIGGGDDPSLGGARISIASPNSGLVAFTVPPGIGKPGWLVRDGDSDVYKFVNPDAPGGPTPFKLVVVKQGKRLKLAAKTAGFIPAGEGAVAVRISMGSYRACARFGSASVLTDTFGRFLGRNAPASALSDCSDASLTAP